MDLEDSKVRPFLWGIFASEISYKEKEQQAMVIQSKIDAGGADICPFCGQVIATSASMVSQKISIGQETSKVECDHAAALQVAQDNLVKYQGSMDSDWNVMVAWINQVKILGVDFFNDQSVTDFRQKVLKTLWEQDEERRVAIYDRIQEISSEQLNSANSEYQDVLTHQQIITDLMAGDCIWWGVR